MHKSLLIKHLTSVDEAPSSQLSFQMRIAQTCLWCLLKMYQTNHLCAHLFRDENSKNGFAAICPPCHRVMKMQTQLS